ncbi:MAG TPA: LD-carboxypeptidase [Casimicrobiaceae bacterium]|nr:LD-carboxypeptidase [Casimicrobiaceae bacterium]
MRPLDIGVYAPAGAVTDPAGVARGVERLAALGHRVVLDEGVLRRHTRFAGTDDERLAAIERIARRDDVDVAIALRGGYGTTRLLARLDYGSLSRSGKRWLGHSDFTAFQLAALARTGMITYAGPAFAYDFGGTEASAFTLRHCFGLLEAREYEVRCTLDGPARLDARGVLWGGNLAMVASLAGTPYLPQVDGGILFLEDVGEHPYRVERMFHQLAYAGVLGRQRAVLLGHFTEYALAPHDDGYDLPGAVAQLRALTPVPVFTGLPFGHVRDKLTLPVGGRLALAVRDGDARLSFHDYAADDR